MKAIVLYDLAAPVEMSPEDAEVVALVNRGRSNPFVNKVIVQDGSDLYLVDRPKRKGARLRDVLSVLLAALICFSVFGLLICGFVILIAPFEVPFSLVLIAWVVFIFGILLTDKNKK